MDKPKSGRIYRYDIDGLRAVAVLLVVFDHLGWHLFSGGFIGVDVFFVISGFLITGIIKREMEANEFTYRKFYVRRIRRILPAFYAVGFATLIAGTFILLPRDLSDLSESFLASSGFVSNIYFWYYSSGYFATSSNELPLLHTWSLSVEEQFYVIWPAVLFFLIVKLKNRFTMPVVIAGILISFLVADLFSYKKIVYFILPTRAGELLLGAIIALYPWMFGNLDRKKNELLAYLGIGLIIAPSILLSPESSFPGLNAFIPCFGVLLLIQTGAGNTFVSRILATTPFVYVGKISYSLYLWHWPLIAYVYYSQVEWSLPIQLTLLVTSFALSHLTWKYVEVPFRSRRLSFAKAARLYVIAPTVLVIATCSSVILTNGISIRHPEMSNPGQADATNRFVCDYGDDCSIGNLNGNVRALLWGDSHAHHLSDFTAIQMKSLGLRGTAKFSMSCAPSFFEYENLGPSPDLCRTIRRDVQSSLLHSEYEYVFLAARWEKLFRRPNDFREVLEFVSKNAEHVVVLEQVPKFVLNPRKCLERGTHISWIDCNQETAFAIDAKYAAANEELRTIARDLRNVSFISFDRFFCTDENCEPFIKGRLAYADEHHLNPTGSQLLGEEYIERNEAQLTKSSRIQDSLNPVLELSL